MAVINKLLHRYGEISFVSYGYCTRACGTRANTLLLTRDISRYQINKIYIYIKDRLYLKVGYALI